LGGSRRTARIERVKFLGRIAYRLLKDAEIVGVVTLGGEDKRMLRLEEYGIWAELLMPFRPWALPTEHFRIEIRFDGRRVFDIRWDRAGMFRCATYEPGEWERILIDWPEPIPFN
jgi:hypothetical protein